MGESETNELSRINFLFIDHSSCHKFWMYLWFDLRSIHVGDIFCSADTFCYDI